MATPKKIALRNRTNRERRSRSHSSRTWRFEQLESRAMLSATMGPMFYGPSYQAMEMHDYGEPQLPQAGMFAPENFEMSMAGLAGWDGRIGGPMAGGRHDDFDWMPPQFDVGPAIWGYDSPAPQHSALTNPNNPSASITVAATPNVWIDPYVAPDIIVNVINVKTINYETPPSPPPDPGGGRAHVDPPGGSISTLYNRDQPGSHEYDPVGKAVGGTGLPYGGVITASVSTQSAPHGVEPSNLLSNGALDAALQAYTSQLLLVSGGVSSQPMTTSTLNDQSLSSADDPDGFVTLSDSATTGDQAFNADTLSRQQAAVEEVLRSLQGDDSLPGEATSSAAAQDGSHGDEQNAQVADFVFGTAYDVAEIDGGMVLLQTTGDANESPVNLARVAESHPDMFSPHIGVEASVGFYQAVDRGFEELSATDNTPTTNPSAVPIHAKPEHRYSSNAGGSSRKAAGVLAASTLAGGLLWVAGRKQPDPRNSDPRGKRSPAV